MESKIIAIRHKNIDEAHEAFVDLMTKTEDLLNAKAIDDHNFCKKTSPSELEKISCDAIKDASKDTPFRASEIILVSGSRFPDIIAEKYYGVEVKSSKQDHWKSTGSSIVESTRDQNVDDLYMLFGKLGGERAEFRCRPYKDVLCDIAVTHSPRYLIDMNLSEGDSIFDKMNVSYDELRTSPDAIELVKNYYRNKARETGRKEMPWWLGSPSGQTVSPVNVRFWSGLPSDLKDEYIAKMFVLFPEVLIGNYENAVIWMCTVNFIMSSSFRDIFSAGGTIESVNGQELDEKVKRKHVFYELVKRADLIEKLFEDHQFLYTQVKEYNCDLINSANPYKAWLRQVVNYFEGVEIVEWFESRATLEIKKKRK